MATTGRSALRKASRSRGGAEQAVERKRTCIHALLNRPWITRSEDPELYFSVKDYYEELRDWFMDKAGFPLLLTRSIAKLDKTPVRAFPWMGFQEFREPRDYIFFTYSLWYLEGKTEMDQFLLSDLVEDIQNQMLGEGLDADWTIYYHRLSMARALKKLKSLGVLYSVDGDEGEWAQNSERNVLFECSPNARYILRRFPQDLMQYQAMEELADPIQYADTQDGQSMRRRHRVYRRFLLEPAVPDRGWEEEDLNYVLWQRRAIIDQLEQTLGWEGRRYREGLLFFHPELTSEAALFPTLSAASDIALLAAGELRMQLYQEDSGRYTEDNGMMRITRAEMESLLYKLHLHHKDYWSKELRESSSQALADLCMKHLEDWGLGEWEDATHFLISPVLARWTAEYRNMDFGD